MTLAPERVEIVARLDRQIADRHVLNHPFYQAWSRGELTLAALQDYAAQYYHHVAAFPAYLSAVHSNTPDADARRIVLQNLMDEEAGSPNHPELWIQFAEGLGVSRETVLNAPLQPETTALIATFRDICRNGAYTDGLAALYAYESQIPEVAETKIAGLQQHYSIFEPETLAYFEVHAEADQVHRAEERKLLARHITAEAQAESASQAADRALNAVWNLLSGLCQRHGIVCH
jgi:pyrroloquinoline-quinone synthase